MKDILERIADSSPTESSHELICRLRDCAHEIEKLRGMPSTQANVDPDGQQNFFGVAPGAPMPDYTNLEGLREKLLAAREIVRDEDGWLTHPDFPICDEDVRADKFLDAFGIESHFVGMDGDADQAFVDRYFEEGESDCTPWTPTPPNGEGWMLLEIYPTEDGPYALFARRAQPVKRLSKRELRDSILSDIRSLSGAHVQVVPQAWQDVTAERQRQVSDEGWTPDHDDRHVNFEMTLSAAYYAIYTAGAALPEPSENFPSKRYVLFQHADALWPWDDMSRKPTGARSNLVKAGALILAEIERIDRAAAPTGDDK
ncbi:hypothetical protein [Paraburkholderia sp.]|jgi:hypothetical protein|uniref:hypothetical protein n=1 Tax=Paraburkholderia sp. TaxID=1926495 RepID=UPI002F41B511